MDLDKIVFKQKKFEDILAEVYDNQKSKSRQISSLIAELKPLISNIGDATLLVPLIKEYLEIGVKNDDQLIKLAGLIQRIGSASEQGDNYSMSEAEKEKLLEEVKKLKDSEGSSESSKKS